MPAAIAGTSSAKESGLAQQLVPFVSRRAAGIGMARQPSQNRNPIRGDVLTFRRQPRIEGFVACPVEPFEQDVGKPACGVLEFGQAERLWFAAKLVPHRAQVDRKTVIVERDAFPIRDDTRAHRRVEHLAQLAEGPPQRRLGVIGKVPEKFAKPFASVWPPGGQEESQQRARLSRRGQRNFAVRVVDTQVSQDRDFKFAGWLHCIIMC
ncbi:hypothetical protein LXM94_25150 [Rhizobium sp. TRM95111]|uniref:hypothetical protein n=1 Tax=Rhizobium alarense TaxID=2846851 RepID=UPI001F1D6E58|nr:hypothetical protein [Rhizobium alarense]MCF3643250.1 hypothetical protein [Rhizobium alarense]